MQLSRVIALALIGAGASNAAPAPRKGGFVSVDEASVVASSSPSPSECSSVPREWTFLDEKDIHGYDELMAALEADPAAKAPWWEFTCDTSIGGRSATRPTSVHELRPGDVDVVAAVGDSITAAFGASASTLLTDWIEFRGVSYSMGGDKDLTTKLTVPNVLRQFNPELKGMSLGTTSGLFGGDPAANRAISGSRASDIVSQADEVVAWMQDPANGVDVANDWKVVTLFIGGNDLCSDVCNNIDNSLPENYGKFVHQTLTKLMQLPRTFVNLVQVVDVTKLYDVKGLLCTPLHWFECGCGASSDATVRGGVTAAAQGYWAQVEAAAANSTFARDDFAVVVQPFFTDIELPTCGDGKPDKSYFAPDCFHFSEKGHQAAAEALWNSMLEPVGKKKTTWQINEGIECPTAEVPFLRTAVNSK